MSNESQGLVIKHMFKDTFDTDAGKKCLAYLEEKFVDVDVYKQGQSFEQTAFREGRRDVIRQILKEVADGR